MRQNGFDVHVSDTAVDGSLVISYAPTVENELATDVPEEASGEPQAGVCNFHIIGPGLFTNFTREQRFNTGPTSTKRAASPSQPISDTVNSQTVAQTDSVPQESSTTQETTTATLGINNPGSAATSMTTPDPQAGEKRAALAALMTTTCSFSIPMLPKTVLVKPRDIVIVPSLRCPGEFLEDFEVESVSYQMDSSTGAVTLSIRGQRPFTGEESMITGTPVEAEIKSICAGLMTPAA